MGRKLGLGHPDDGRLYILYSLLMLLVFVVFTIILMLYMEGGDSNGLEETGNESSTVPVQNVSGPPAQQEEKNTEAEPPFLAPL